MIALGIIFPVVTLGCSSTHVAPSEENTPAQTKSPIIGGQADNAHPAVVSFNEVCGGTIIRVDPPSGTGWVLTAAHCLPGAKASGYVLQGTDLRAASIRYFGINYVFKDPRYNSVESPYDLALARIVGVDATTPVLPLVSANEDTLAVGSPVTIVGYGRTVVGAKDAGAETSPIRKSIGRQVTQLTATHVVHSNDGGGSCYGDSGGAVVATLAGSQRLVGVNSYVSSPRGPVDCGPSNSGYAVRVTTAVREWVAQTIAQATAADASCDSCRNVQLSGAQTCAADWRTCLLDDDCIAYRTCTAACSSFKCFDACIQAHPRGYGFDQRVETCICSNGCHDSCSAFCISQPKCGIAPDTSGSCARCTESSCCSELLDCATDGSCSLCRKDGSADAGDGGLPACATHPKRLNIAACTRTKCKAECHPNEASTSGQNNNNVAPTSVGEPPSTAPESSDGSCQISARRRAARMAGCGPGLCLLLLLARRRTATRRLRSGRSAGKRVR